MAGAVRPAVAASAAVRARARRTLQAARAASVAAGEGHGASARAAVLASRSNVGGGCAARTASGLGVGPRALRVCHAAARAAAAAGQAEPEPASPDALNERWHVAGAVRVEEGVAGMTRVKLSHANGSVAGVYLHGANVTSWQISNGSEVLYVRPDTPLDGVKPISGGIPLCFPQFGPGGDTPGGIPGQAPMQQHGFARNMDWDICATGLTQLREPYVRLRLRDTPYSRAMWDHAFELEYEVVLGARDLGLTLMVRNTGGAQFAFTAALHSYLGVQDVREEGVQLLGLQGTTFIDKLEDPTQPVVRVETAPAHVIRGPTDKVFVDSQARVALEVGTGCTVFVENTAGFKDHVVWNPWESNEHYPNFLCVENAIVGAPVQLAKAQEWVGKATLFVRDIVLSAGMTAGAAE